MVNHECDMLLHGQPVTQRQSEVVFPINNSLFHGIPMLLRYPRIGHRIP